MKKTVTLLVFCALVAAGSILSAADATALAPREGPAGALDRLADELMAAPPAGYTRAEVAIAFGWMNLFGMTGAADPARAVAYLQTALDDGLAEAGVVLGAVFSGQEELAAGMRDLPRALDYYEKAAAGGSIDAMRMLGVIYADGGDGIDVNPDKSRHYLMAAAARGSEMALQRLDPLVEEAAAWERDNPGQKADFPSTREELVDPSLAEEARQRAQRFSEATAGLIEIVAARLGEDDAAALSRAGAAAAREGGEDLWAEVEKAIDAGAMEIVDDQPDAKRKGEAALVIGVLHYMGLLHGQDVDKARQFLEIALEHDVPEARVTLGELYIGLTRDDETVERDVARGLAYLEAAAKDDSVDALRLLGIIYSEGVEGIPVDAEKAEGYFLAAARYGDFEALERLEPVFTKAAEWEKENPGEKSPLPTGPEAVIVPELAEKARVRGDEINAMVEHVNAEFEKKVLQAVRRGAGEEGARP